MSEEQIAGMEARSRGKSRKRDPAGSATQEWLIGYNLMDERINETIRYAKDFRSEVSVLKKKSNMRMVAG